MFKRKHAHEVYMYIRYANHANIRNYLHQKYQCKHFRFIDVTQTFSNVIQNHGSGE